MDNFSIYPVNYHTPTIGPIRNFVTTRSQSKAASNPPNSESTRQLQPLDNSEITDVTRQLTRYQAILYGFGGGHIHHTLSDNSLPITIVAGADLDSHARSLMQELMHIPRIFDTARKLYDWIASNDDTYTDIYISHAPLRLDSSFVHCWWDFQAKIIRTARIKKGLQVFVILIPSSFHVQDASDKFSSYLRRDNWVLSSNDVQFQNFGDSIDDRCTALFGVHRSTQAIVHPLSIITPPLPRVCQPIHDFIYEPFDDMQYAVSFSRQQLDQYMDEDHVSVDPLPDVVQRHEFHSRRMYDLVEKVNMGQSHIGTGVYDRSHLFPPVSVHSSTTNPIFGRFFGIEFKVDDLNVTLVRQISPYEVVRGFGFSDKLSQHLALGSNLHLLPSAVPSNSSLSLMSCLADRIRDIRDSCVNVDESTPYAAPAATSQILFNGATGHTLPDTDAWLLAYEQDPETKLLISMVKDPSLIVTNNMNKLHFVYRRYIRESRIALTPTGMLVIYESIQGSDDFAELQIVPVSLRNIVFIAFHANPLGGHFNTYRTMHRIRLRFWWPRMYSYIDKMIEKCAGCKLTNPGIRKSAELVYSFPVTEPMVVLHVDCYMAGAIKTYDNVSAYLVAACNMTGFACIEGINESNAASFAGAIMRIMLRYGMAHTLILDKDSKFFGTFKETGQLLKIQTHTISRANHDAMLVERLNKYYNKALKIFVSEHNRDPRVGHEGLFLANYAWNCLPVPGTDISRCLIVTGREWHFPIDFSNEKHLELVSRPQHIHSFAERQATLLSASRELGRILIEEHRAAHRERINSLRPDPKIYEPGDHVFAQRKVHSNKSKNRVGKLEFPSTGPWIILRRLRGASYECRHSVSNKIEKFHASHLSPVPLEIIPFAPIDGPDHRFGQLNKPLSDEAYKAAGIEGFLPKQPWKRFEPQPFDDSTIPTSDQVPDTTTNLVQFNDQDLHFPSLWELNAELDTWDDVDLDALIDDTMPIAPSTTPIFATASTPTPCAGPLASSIVASDSRLFFISWKFPTQSRREWHLVQLQLDSSMALNPDCLVTGRFLVNFFICHPRDANLHPRNQRWWLEYHPSSSVARIHQGDYHLVRPDNYASVYAKENSLHPFCQWVNLLHTSTFIHGPFEFATINGRKTRDRIAVEDWQKLTVSSSKYDNAPPNLDTRDYNGIQFSRSYHSTIVDPSVEARLLATCFTQPESYSTQSL